MNNDLLAQMAMQMQSPEAVTQMAGSPIDPWAVMAAIAQKTALSGTMSTGPQVNTLPGERDERQKTIGGLLSMGASTTKQQQPQMPPVRVSPGGRPAAKPAFKPGNPQQMPPSIGALLSRGGPYG